MKNDTIHDWISSGNIEKSEQIIRKFVITIVTSSAVDRWWWALFNTR